MSGAYVSHRPELLARMYCVIRTNLCAAATVDAGVWIDVIDIAF